MIRPAKFIDAVRIVELMHEMHGRSRYRDIDEVSDKRAHALASHLIHRHGGVHDGGSFMMVAVRDQKVEGFMGGLLSPTYLIGKKLMAEDVFLYLSKKALAVDMLALIKAYVAWAANNPKVVEIKLSWTDAIENADQIEGVYDRFGFRRCGAIWCRDNHGAIEERKAA